jgi:glycolate oxidase FAD binding subunit
MTPTFRPTTLEDLAARVTQAAGDGERLELRGGGSKADMGAPRSAAVVDMTGLHGIVDYDPAELVLTAFAGTPLAQIQTLLAQRGQMLAFDPYDHGPLFGRPSGSATLGGVLTSGVAGSRRISRGAARDHLLGFKAVSGRGEVFVGGAKVTKNVTGYDLPKLVCGSWGRLMALAEVTVKVLPRAPVSLTLALDGLEPLAAVSVMSRALGSQGDVAAAAHANGVTALKLEGFGPSVAARRTLIESLLADAGQLRPMDGAEEDAFWNDMHALPALADAPALWRVILPPRNAPELIAAVEPHGARWAMDWGGGLIWLAMDDAAAVRAAAQSVQGHAQLVRAPEALRAATPMLHPQLPMVATLEARVRRAFDPAGVFESGRFLDSSDAD